MCMLQVFQETGRFFTVFKYSKNASSGVGSSVVMDALKANKKANKAYFKQHFNSLSESSTIFLKVILSTNALSEMIK